MNLHDYPDPDRPDEDLVRLVFPGGHMIMTRHRAHEMHRAIARGLGFDPGTARYEAMHRRAQRAEAEVRAYRVLLAEEPKPRRRWARYADVLRAQEQARQIADWCASKTAQNEARLDLLIRAAWSKISTAPYPGDAEASAVILADLDAMAQLRTLLSRDPDDPIEAQDVVDTVASVDWL